MARSENRAMGSLQALVVFCDDGDIWWLRWLRKGYRHCFVAVRDQGRWILCDPLSHQTYLKTTSALDGVDLADRYETSGLVVVPCKIQQAPRRAAPLRPFTCVEAVKRVLGLHLPWVWTPWQLYRRLNKKKKEKNHKKGLTWQP